MAAPVATVAVIAGVLLWQSQQTPALTARATVVLSDFRNSTGDAMFDDTLSQALAVQLRQSPFFNILPEQQLEATLQMMGRPAMEPLTMDVSREICVRAGAKAILGGTIAAIGNQYLLTLSAQDCVNGATIAEEAVTAAGKDAVLASLGLAATAFREQLGESLSSVQRYDQNIEQATTRSREALKAYSQGMTTRRTQGDFDSLPFFRRAVELDAEFALAHARLDLEEAVRLASMQPLGHLNLAGVYADSGRFDDARRTYEKVLELQENVSARVGLMTVAAFTGDRALVATHAAAARGPRSAIAVAAAMVQIEAYSGRMQEAARQTDEMFRLIRDERRLGDYSEAFLGFAINQALTGRAGEARRQMDRFLAEGELSEGATDEILALATLFDDQQLADAYSDRALKHYRETSSADDFPRQERAIHCLLTLVHGKNQEAYGYCLSNGADPQSRNLVFMAGIAALRLQQWDNAASAFGAVAGFGSRLGLAPTHGAVRIWLARAHAGAGRHAEARKAYEEAFAIWKDADADLPLLVEARQEYQRLTS